MSVYFPEQIFFLNFISNSSCPQPHKGVSQDNKMQHENDIFVRKVKNVINSKHLTLCHQLLFIIGSAHELFEFRRLRQIKIIICHSTHGNSIRNSNMARITCCINFSKYILYGFMKIHYYTIRNDGYFS